MELKQKHQIWIHSLQLEQLLPYLYSAIVTLIPSYFPFTSVYFETAAIIITLILIGRLLETRTKEKASDAVRKLLDLQPKMAKSYKESRRVEEVKKKLRFQ